MKTFRNIMSWVLPIVLGLGLALLIKTYWFQPVKVDGSSMDPNLSSGQRVLALKTGLNDIKRGQIVVFDAFGEDPKETTHKNYVKRVIAVPGDTVSAKDGVIKVNGKEVDQSYISENEQYATNFPDQIEVGNWKSLKQLGENMSWEQTPTEKVPDNKYFVLGDHRSVSNDSRYWGYIDQSKVLGTVKVPFWDNEEQKKAVNSEWQAYFAK